MAIGTIIGTASTKIPWDVLIKYAPDILVILKDKLNSKKNAGLEEQIKLLHEENDGLKQVLIQQSEKIEALVTSLEIVTSRLTLAIVIAVISLVFAIGTLVYCIVRI